MRDVFIGVKSPWRKFLPLMRRTRQWASKYHNRVGSRLVISGGKIQFMDVELEFPEKVGLQYSTPLFWDGPEAYEGPTSRAIAALAAHSKLFLDVGSNIGIYAVYVGKKYPNIRTIAFEPVPEIWEKNRQFHRCNNLDDRSIFKLALGEREGVQKIFLPVYSNGWEEEQTATLRSDLWQTREEQVKQFEIQCTTLDAFWKANPLPQGNCFLKIDVENYEAAVLRGGQKFIAQRRPWIVCEILSGQEIDAVTKKRSNNNSDVVSMIQEMRYVPFAITAEGFFRMNPVDFNEERQFKDFLLLPREAVLETCFYQSLATLKKIFQSSI